MAYKPPKQQIDNNDVKNIPSSEAIYEALKYKIDQPTISGTAGQLLQLDGYTTDPDGILNEPITSWVNPPASGANTSLSNLSSVAINTQLRGVNGTETSPAYSFTGDTNTGIYLASADTLGLSTGGTERMRITASGDVGIGTTTPTNKLDVGVTAANNNSGIEITNTNSAGYGGCLSFAHRTTAGGAVAVRSQITSEGGGNNSFMRFFTTLSNSATEKMRLTGEGSVLVGTTDASVYTAGALLKVASSSVSNNARMEIRGATTTDQAALDLGAGAQRNGVIAGQDQSLLFLTNSAAGTSGVAERMRITSAGNLGIGTITPSEKLSVNGSVLIQQNNIQTNLLVQAETPYNAQTLANFYLGAANSSAVNNGTAYRWLFGVEGVATGKALTFSSETNTGVTERMRIDSSGNVGIGTASPAEKLEVAGAVLATEYRVPNYRLDPHTHDEGTETTDFTINWANGAVHTVTLNAAGPLVITMNNPVDGGAYALRIIQGATPGTVTWPANVKWPGGTPPTLSTNTGDIDVVNLLYFDDGGGNTFYYATSALAFA